MLRPLFRWTLRALVSAVAVLAAAALVAHLGPVRNRVRAYAESRLSRALDGRVTIGSLDYNLLRLSATARDVSLAPPEGVPFLSARRATVLLGFSPVGRATRHISSIELDHPRLDLGALERWLASRPPRPPATAAPGPLRVDRVSVTGFDVTHGTSTWVVGADITGLALDMAPDERHRLHGTIRLDGQASMLIDGRTYALDTLRDDLAFDGRDLHVSALQLKSRDLDARLSGTFEILRQHPAANFTVAGSADVAVVQPWLPDGWVDAGRLAFTTTMSGPYDRMDVAFDVTSESLRLREGTRATLAAAGRVVDGRLRLERAELAAEGGTVTGSLTHTLPGGAASDTMSLRFVRLPLKRALAVTGVDASAVAAAATGSVTSSGPLGQPERLQARLTATLQPAATAGIPVAGRVSLGLDGGNWRAETSDLHVGPVAASGSANGSLAAAPSRFAKASLRGHVTLNVDDLPALRETLATLGLDQARDLGVEPGGAARAALTLGGSLGRPTVEGPVGVTQARVARLAPIEAAAQVRVDATHVVVSDLRVTHDQDLATGEFAYAFGRGGLEGRTTGTVTDLSRLLVHVPPAYRPTAGHATFDLALRGTAAHPLLSGAVNVANLTAAGQRIDRATASVEFEAGLVRVDHLEAEAGKGRLTASATYDARNHRFAVEGLQARQFPVAPFPGANVASAADDVPLAATIDLDGHARGTFDEPEVEATLHARDVTWNGEAVGEVSGAATTRDGAIQFRLGAPQVDVLASGALGAGPEWPVDARLTLSGGNVAKLARLAGVAGRLAPDTSGTADAAVAVRGPLVRRDELTYVIDVGQASLRSSGLDLRLTEPAHLEVQAGTASALSVSVAAGVLRARVDRAGAQAPFRVAVDGELRDLSPWLSALQGQPLTLEGTVRANVDVPGLDRVREARGTLEVAGGSVKYAEWPAVSELNASARVAGGRATLDHASARWVSASITATGDVPLALVESALPDSVRGIDAGQRGADPMTSDSGPARLEVAVTSLDRAVLVAVFGEERLARASIDVDLTIKAEATAPRLDALTAEVSLTRAEGQLGDLQLVQVAPGRLDWHGRQLTIAPWQVVGPGTDVTVSGLVAFGGQEPVCDVAAKGTVDLRILDAFVSGYTGGSAIVQLAAHGPVSGLSWSGRVNLLEGVWLLRERNLAAGGINGSIVLDGNRIAAEHLTGRLNGGSAALGGEITTGPKPGGAFTVTLRDVGFELPAGTRHDLDGDLELRAQSPPLVSGTVRIRPGMVHNSLVMLAAALNSLQRDPLDVDLPGQSAASSPRLDIRVLTSEDLVFDSNDLRLAAHADLHLEGTFDEPELRGRVSARDDGEVFLLGRTWKIEAGTVDFVEGTVGTEARLAVSASAQVSRYRVQMRVTGPPSEMNMSLNSTPPLGQSDLTELVMTGGVSSGNTTRRGGEQVAGAISGEFLGTFGHAVGIDAVRIEQGNTDDLSAMDLEPVSRLTVAKRLGPYFEVVYSQSLSNSDDVAWVLYYRPGWHDVEARFTYRTSAPESYELRQEFEFGGPARAKSKTTRTKAPRIASVEISGVPEDEAARLRQTLKLKPGSRFGMEAWQNDEDRLRRHYWDQDRYLAKIRATRATTDEGRVALSYDISPGPPTVLRVTGYEPDTATMDAMRQTWSRVALEEFLTEELADPIRLQLAKEGYFSPEIRTVFSPLPPGDGRQALVTVSPGQRSARRQVRFSGNEGLADAELRKVVDARCRDLRCWVTPSTLQGPLQGYYRSHGFLSARVKAPPLSVADGTATLTINVEEGPRYEVGRLDVAGADAVGSETAARAFALAPGAPFDTAGYTNALSNLRAYYRRAGYRSVKVDAVPIPRATEPKVDITLNVVEGPRSVLESVTASGQANVRKGLFDKVVALQPGGPVDLVALDKSQQRLYDTGIFDSVEVGLEPVRQPGPETAEPVPSDEAPRPDAGVQRGDQPVTAVFKLEERPHYRLRYGVQFGPTSIEDIAVIPNSAVPGATVELQRRNLFGEGLNVGIGGFWSANQYRVRATAQTFTFLGRFLQTTATAETVQQDLVRSGDSEYLARTNRLILEQRLRRGKTRRLELAYGFEVDLAEVELLKPVRLPSDAARISALESTLTYDTRDNPFNPGRGQFHSSRVEVSPGAWLSDIAFGRYQLQQFAYFPLGRLLVASGLRFGSLDVDNEEELVGLLLRFTTGGATTVRGYAQDSLVPQENLALERCLNIDPAYRVACGGKVLLVLNEELRFPIWRWFGGVAFVDAGNTFEGLRQFSLDGLKVGMGVGLRLNTPVLVIRLDVGFPVPREPSGPLNRWYIGIGQAF